MTVQDSATLKGYFNTGDTPTESNFADVVDTLFDQANITEDSAALGGDVTLTAGSWTDVLSLSLPAGTWLVLGNLGVTAAQLQTVTARVTDGTTHYAGGAITIGGTNHSSTIPVMPEPIVLASTTTIKLQGHTQTATTAATARRLTGVDSIPWTTLRAIKVA